MRLKKVISNFHAEQISLGDYRVHFVSHPKAIQELNYSDVDAIVVENLASLSAVLSSDTLYLKPLFFNGETNRQCDGIYDSSSINRMVQRIEIIHKSIENYEDNSLPEDSSLKLLAKLLRYLFSRNLMLAPVNTRLSNIGYDFPLISDMSVESDPLFIMNILNGYSKQNFFSKVPLDKINICYDCQSSYLNFSECCTKCNALDLETEELVHHFRCAYVGPQSDFLRDAKLICPKCDHQLKHIGIDYDKPSEIHTCKSCNHSSQETKMKAKCVDCQKENELEQLVTHEIFQYNPTDKAKSFANQSHKSDSFFNDEKELESNTMNYGAYNLIKSHEARRSRSANLSSYELVVSVDQSILKGLNIGMRRSLVEELSAIIKPYLKVNDLVAIDNELNIHLLQIDYSPEDFESVEKTLDYNLNKMLIDNGWSSHAIVSFSGQKVC